MSINDATPKEWDRAAKSQTPHGGAIADAFTDAGIMSDAVTSRAIADGFTTGEIPADAIASLENYWLPESSAAPTVGYDQPQGDALENYWESSDLFDGYKQPPGYVEPVNSPEHYNTKDIDPVNSPEHYNTGDIECIAAIKASMSPEAFSGYCKGNALKYLWRLSYKGKPVEDVRKGIWYANELLVNELEHPKK